MTSHVHILIFWTPIHTHTHMHTNTTISNVFVRMGRPYTTSRYYGEGVKGFLMTVLILKLNRAWRWWRGLKRLSKSAWRQEWMTLRLTMKHLPYIDGYKSLNLLKLSLGNGLNIYTFFWNLPLFWLKKSKFQMCRQTFKKNSQGYRRYYLKT